MAALVSMPISLPMVALEFSANWAKENVRTSLSLVVSTTLASISSAHAVKSAWTSPRISYP